MSKDNDYLQRIKIFKKYPDFFYKVLIIAMYNTHVCCCGSSLNFEENFICSCFKTGQIIFETFKNIEEQNLSLNIKEIKMKCVDFMIKNLGKNIAGAYLLKMENISNNKNEIFNYIIKETNLLKERLQRKKDGSFGHCIDDFEKFISSCNNPELIYDILIMITTPKDRYEIRIYRILLIILTNIIKDNDTEQLEKYIYNREIFENLLDTLSYDIWLGEYEGIWEVLLNSENKSIIKIFNKNKYNVTEILDLQINKLFKNGLNNSRLSAVIRIMVLFLKIGEKFKKEFDCDNYYANEFKKIYIKIPWYKELKQYFK